MSATLGRTWKVGLRRAVVLGCVAAGIVSVAGCRRKHFPTYPANYREYLYVANSGSNTVSAIDVVHLRLDREITVGEHPVAVLASKSRNEVYVLNSGLAGGGSRGSGSVSIVDAEHQRVTATLDVGPAPVAFALSPDDRFAYVASAGRSSLVVVDLLHRRIAASLPLLAAPTEVAVAPDGRSVLVSSAAESSLLAIAADETENRWSVRARIAGCPGAGSMAVLPDSSKAFVACARGHQLMAVRLAWQQDLAAGRQETRADALEALLDVGQNPGYLALKPDGGELFVSNTGSNSISEVVTFSNDVGGTYLIGSMPEFGVVSPDNSLLYESSLQSQEVAVYSIDDGRRKGSIHVGDGPDQLAFSASGYLLFVLDRRSGDVAAIRTDTQSMFTFFSVGRVPVAIADKNFTI